MLDHTESGVFALAGPSFPITGLTAYWRLDELSGNARVDTSGNGRNLSEGGGSVSSAAGIRGNAASFDGVTLRWLGSSNAGLGTSGQVFTISCWIKLNDLSTNQAVLGKYTSGGAADGYKLYYDLTAGVLAIRSADSNGPNEDQLTSAVVLSDFVWYHVVCGFDGLNHFMVINGGTRELDEGLAATDSSNDFRIGSDDDGLIFNGLIDDVGIWIGTVLTDEQVAIIYNGGIPLRPWS